MKRVVVDESSAVDDGPATARGEHRLLPSLVLRALSVSLTGLLVVAAVVATAQLVVELVNGAPDLRQASALLTTGSLVWIDANLTFALLYWEFDSGGAAERLHHVRPRSDLAFPQHMNPELATPGWRPVLTDYLYLGFTNATAFSPTDAMPLAHWAKAIMAIHALISIVILSLVIATRSTSSADARPPVPGNHCRAMVIRISASGSPVRCCRPTSTVTVRRVPVNGNGGS